MSKHTPGPWTADDHATRYGDGSYGIYAPEAEPGEKMPALANPCRAAEANARLIAAAPDLLEALRALEARVRVVAGAHDPIMQRAREAIAKAEG